MGETGEGLGGFSMFKCLRERTREGITLHRRTDIRMHTCVQMYVLIH